MEEVLQALSSGKAAFWRPETGEVVFVDRDFDDAPSGTGKTACLTWVDPARVAAGGHPVGDADTSGDDYIDRAEAAEMIASQPGWERVPM